MKKIIILLLATIMLSSCGVTYYTYYEVEDLETTTTISKQDAVWSPSHKTPSRCVAAYPDSTGKVVYLMETKIKENKEQ